MPLWVAIHRSSALPTVIFLTRMAPALAASSAAFAASLAAIMKDIYIADLAAFDEGKLFDGFFLVLAKQQRTTKTNKPYLNLILGDKTGQLEGRVWEPGDPRIARDFDKGDIVKARGSASRFDDRPASPGAAERGGQDRPAALDHL